ncbi:hypothetical protein KXS11_11975 [Plantibacter flavus]|uniref:hypothetical protein n=1 Tax=Plantibacter flavus TaxID=150123 RepID=UPI003F14E298
MSMKSAASNGVWYPVLFIIAFGAAQGFLLREVALTQPWVVLFAAAMLALMLGIAWLELFRAAHRIDVVDTSIIEHRAFRKRVIPIAEIVSVSEPKWSAGPMLGQPGAPRTVAIRLATGRSVWVKQRDGFNEFLSDLRRVNQSIADERTHPPRNDHASRYWPLTTAEATASRRLVETAASPTTRLGNQANEGKTSGS